MKRVSTAWVMSLLAISLFAGAATQSLAEVDKSATGPAGRRIIVSGTGDSQSLLMSVARYLKKRLKDSEIEVPNSVGSGGGIKALTVGKADLARVARPLTEEERELGLGYRCFAKCPVVFVVHPSVAGIDGIRIEEIIGIYSGKITNWTDIGAQAGKIYAVTREPGDSSLSILNEILPGFKDIADPVAAVAYKTQDAVKTIENHPGTIGFLPLTMARGTSLRILKVNGMYPSGENVVSGKYTLTVPFGIVYRGDLTGLAKIFVDSLHSEEGKRIITEYGAIPVR